MKARFPALHDTLEAISLFIFTPFFLFYGLVPVFGGDGLGLVGADEPRYAQIAREISTQGSRTPYLIVVAAFGIEADHQRWIPYLVPQGIQVCGQIHAAAFLACFDEQNAACEWHFLCLECGDSGQ